jgi:hypothetical protein
MTIFDSYVHLAKGVVGGVDVESLRTQPALLLRRQSVDGVERQTKYEFPVIVALDTDNGICR